MIKVSNDNFSRISRANPGGKGFELGIPYPPLWVSIGASLSKFCRYLLPFLKPA